MSVAKRVGIALVALALGAGVWFGIRRGAGADGLLASGTVEATEAQLGFPVAGRIADIAVDEGDLVKAGDELAHLERNEMLARRQQAAAQAVASRALLSELERGSRSEEVAQARAALAGAEQRLEEAKRDFDRTRVLHDGGAVSQEAFDRAQVALAVAQSQRDQAAEQAQLVETGPRRERIDAQRAQVHQAEAAVRALDAGLANLTVRAPFNGLVTVRDREPGEILPAGAPVLTVMNLADRWVRIYVPEDRIGAVRLGAKAAISTDTYPGHDYAGEVMFIASQAEFTPKSVQTTEERVKLVYQVKARITGDSGNVLKPGMPADVRMDLAAP